MMTDTSSRIFERLRLAHGKDIDLSLRPAYRDLLAKLGDPQEHLPPVFHVAGTNGKGSVCAFLRAVLEASGKRVHVYTSPHLITLHERIRLAGRLIDEEELVDVLLETEAKAAYGSVSFFEALTAAAFVAMARHPADFVILETGMGGRLDATNVVTKPLASIITRLSYDHREYLGNTLDKIAREKAGILRAYVPCFAAFQPDPAARAALHAEAQAKNAPLMMEGESWTIERTPNGFRFKDGTRTDDLPTPSLLGEHQYHNAGLALAALSAVSPTPSRTARKQGMLTVEWPARLQRLGPGALTAHAPDDAEIWLDGGHNDSAGEVLKKQVDLWRVEDGKTPKPLYVVLGMLKTKKPMEFIGPFATDIAHLGIVPIPHTAAAFTPEALAESVGPLKIEKVDVFESVIQALEHIKRTGVSSPRILVCGSLYLAGSVLSEHKV
ncbi:MAG: bifunctional folylpolyglutamate synthase/dihydrofolate synthase [Alphaproteobacteria bacterium]|nr:bifunctional folylpolyglutamate synthase/dihydrofolate synthase [Alphaproteobacteria bacterium]